MRLFALLIGLAGLALTGGGPPATVHAGAEPAAGDQGKKSARESDFLMFGTVFTEAGLALRGAEIRVRRAGERKMRWEARSDRRGEFAVRVPRGAEYEINVSAAGHQAETRKIDARTGSRQDLAFQLAPASGGKPK
ncbi:MAG: carboxypeptidase-like regulatory domain-containing protein [Candidatus Acidiferrales bacterium]